MQPSSAAWGLPAPWGHHHALHGYEPTHVGGVLHVHVHVDPSLLTPHSCISQVCGALRRVTGVSRSFDTMVDCRSSTLLNQ